MKLKKLSLVSLYSMLIMSAVYANTLVITKGPVCSGMGRYLTNAIQELDNSYYRLSQNEVFHDVCYQLFSAVFPHHMTIINRAIEANNITPAIVYYHCFFKETADHYEKLQAAAAIQEIQSILNDPINENFLNALSLTKNHFEMAELAYHAACNHNVVWEKRSHSNWDYNTTQIEALFGNVLNTATYCPPTSMITLWHERNNQAIHNNVATDKRLIKEVILSFFNNVQPADEYQNTVIMLSKEDFHAIFQQAANYIMNLSQYAYGLNGIFTRSEFTLEELYEFKNLMYEKFNFDNVEYILLTLTMDYDILLSSKEDCLEFAQELING